jgi:hypothetical protein
LSWAPGNSPTFMWLLLLSLYYYVLCLCFTLRINLTKIWHLSFIYSSLIYSMEPSVKPSPKKRQRNEIANEIQVQADHYEFQERMTR